jgi:hypothetical protein
MPKRIKERALLILALVLVVLAFLAAGMPNLVFHPGKPFSLADASLLPENMAQGLGGGDALLMALWGFMALIILLLPFYILMHLFSREGRQRLLADVCLLGVLLLASSLASKLGRNTGRSLPAAPVPLAPLPDPSSHIPPTVFTANPSQWVVTAVAIGMAVLLFGLGIFVYWYYLKKKHSGELHPIQRLANEAQNALDEIYAGGNLKNIILRCYAQMNAAVQQSYGIRREAALTPREFEQILVEKGLPQAPVQNLTLLFEEARYSSKEAGEREEHKAISSLEAIVSACQSVKKASAHE